MAQQPDKVEAGDIDVRRYILFAGEEGAESVDIDSLFFLNSLPIVFQVGRTDVIANNRELRHFIEQAVPLLNSRNMADARIRIRSAASPEGSLRFNQQLSRGRRDELLRLFTKYGITSSKLQVDIVDEEYELLAFNMRQADDPDAPLVSRLVHRYGSNASQLKNRLMNHDGGRLWNRILREYFPALRASRFMVIFPGDSTLFDPIPKLEPAYTQLTWPVIVPEPLTLGKVFELPTTRRELLSVKTNLLEWLAYVPQYGFCPMPNVEIEYYPRHGHFTYGATFDCPWWVGNTTNHKYFELRNYQLYTRYYLRNSDLSYADPGLTVPAKGKAAFQRFYLEAYVQAFLYQIGFSATKGWIGEGLGGGLGLGYVLPISRDGHWRLDFGLQLGMFYTKYDPFVYGRPIYHGGEIDGLYYYDTDLYRKDFVKRQHRYTYLGPTRVGISLSYDLLYRRNDGRRKPSFRSREKGDGL